MMNSGVFNEIGKCFYCKKISNRTFKIELKTCYHTICEDCYNKEKHLGKETEGD